MNVIESDGITKLYEGVLALDHVSFTVGRGEIFALVGPNGAGKTTLLRLLTDIMQPDSGNLSLLGSTRIRTVLNQIGYMPEERGLYKNLTPMDTVAYFAELKGLSARDSRMAAETALKAVGMYGHGKRKMEELSKGMAQRVQFAGTIVHNPPLLLMDEPFSGLDPVSARDLQQLIRNQRDTGHTILLSTHNMEHAEKLCDRLLMLHRGRVVLFGEIEDIKARYTDNSVRIAFTGCLPELPNVEVISDDHGTAIVRPRDGLARRDIIASLMNCGVELNSFEPVVPALEDIFIRVVGEEGMKAMRETSKEAERIIASI